jgi:hypothetical protein
MKKSTESIANHFVYYLVKKYNGGFHVQRVASWIGFIVLGLAKVRGIKISLRRSRQLEFEYKKRRFKVKFNHTIGKRGGIDIIEILTGRGEPEGGTVLGIKTLLEAENAYHSLEFHLKNFLKDK